jgi:hypothetical protein
LVGGYLCGSGFYKWDYCTSSNGVLVRNLTSTSSKFLHENFPVTL